MHSSILKGCDFSDFYLMYSTLTKKSVGNQGPTLQEDICFQTEAIK